MNEMLINKLVDDTADAVPGVCTLVYEGGTTGVEFNWKSLEKFAELIVKECLAECWYDKTPLEISNAIRAKFGMELIGEGL